MSEQTPYESSLEDLGALVDQPVEPRAAFADQLRSRLMSELSASDYSREEHSESMDAMLAPRPPVAFPTERARRIRPMAILELAAVAVIVLGLVAALSRGWFQNDPDTPPSVPAVAQQSDETPTPVQQADATATSTPAPNEAVPTVVPDSSGTETATPVPGVMEPTVVPPGNIAGTLWALPGTEGESVDFGGLLVDDDMVYRLLATPSFVGVQAVDAETGGIVWQVAHRWAGYLFTLEDDTLYFDGGDNRLVAVDAKTGAERWSAQVEGNPIALDDGDGRIFVLLDSDFVTALDATSGEQLWVAQGQIPQNPTGGSASIPAIGKIAEEDGVVAAISTYGVLSGFDAQTGKELWAHEMYDAATVSIETEDGQFIVTSGSAGSVAGVASAGSSSSAASGTPAAIESGTVSMSEPEDAMCASFAGSPEAGAVAAGSAPGTPGMGVQIGGSAGANFRIQTIDPKTGDVLQESQASGGPGAHGEGIGFSVACAGGVNAEPGDAASSSQAPSTGGEIAGSAGTITIWAGDDGDVLSAGQMAGIDGATIAAVLEDDAIYLQLADGTLVKVAADSRDSGDDHHEDQDHDSDDSTPESDDD